MAKQIVAWCDVHLTRDNVQVPGSSVQVTFDHGMPMELDLCEPCHKELVEPLAHLLAEHGQPIRSTSPPQRSASGRLLMPCPQCGKEYTQKKGLAKHLATMHPEAEPDPALFPQQDGDGYKCPECDRVFSRPQGLGRHRLTVHNVQGTSR